MFCGKPEKTEGSHSNPIDKRAAIKPDCRDTSTFVKLSQAVTCSLIVDSFHGKDSLEVLFVNNGGCRPCYAWVPVWLAWVIEKPNGNIDTIRDPDAVQFHRLFAVHCVQAASSMRVFKAPLCCAIGTKNVGEFKISGRYSLRALLFVNVCYKAPDSSKIVCNGIRDTIISSKAILDHQIAMDTIEGCKSFDSCWRSFL
jgi:hypothetical protein